MIRSALIPWLLSLATLAAAEAPDLLRFTNGDQLHGTFLGLQEGPHALWRRDDMAAPVTFKTTRIRHVVLHGGRPLKPLAALSHLGLVNGDRIPGTITGITDTSITLDTPFAGVLNIPRKQVAMAAPNPLGGRVYYHGPFVADEWSMVTTAFPDGLPPAAVPKDDPNDDQANADPNEDQVKELKVKDDKAKDDKAKDAKAKDAPAKDAPAKDDKAKDAPAKDDKEVKADKIPDVPPGRWVFSGTAWYWKNKRAGTALIRETGMPDRAVLRFDLAWKKSLCLAVAFHADFARAKPKEEAPPKPNNNKARGFNPGDATDLPRLFGNSYVLQLFSNYLMLYRTAISEDGKKTIEPVQLNNNSLRLMDSGEAKVELRSNRLSGAISLFINEEFVTQWSENNGAGHDGANYAGKGSGFGFLVQGEDAPVRISDVVVSEWNGMPDSARSLQVDDQDIVLMANGTDRYAGHVSGLDKQGKVLFEGKHGQFQFPLDEVAEVRFARDHLAPAPEVPADNLIVRFSPIGAVSGRPVVSGDASKFGILNSSAGELKLALDCAVMVDFNSTKQIIDDWDAAF